MPRKSSAARSAERSEAIRSLLTGPGELRPGDTVFTVLRHVSSTGMSRSIDCYVFRPRRPGARECEPMYLSGLVAHAIGYPFDERRGGVKIGGCGMDMGFAIVNHLSTVLFNSPEGKRHSLRKKTLTSAEYDNLPESRKRCYGRQNNAPGDRDYHLMDRGYWLNQRWLG